MLHDRTHRWAPQGAFANEQVEQEQVGEDAVALGEVHLEAVAARLFTTHRGASLDHLRTNVLKADRRLVHGDVVSLAEPFAHGALVDRLNDWAEIFLVFEHVVGQQSEDLQLMQEDSALIYGSSAVGVAIEEHPHVVAAPRHAREHWVNVRPNRLRVHAAEPRVALAAHLVDDHVAARKESADPASASAVHRVNQDAHLLGGDRLQVEVALNELLVARVRVVALNEACRLGVSEWAANEFRAAGARHMCLDALQQVWPGSGARWRLHLKAVIHPGVVAGGNDDTHRRATHHHLVGGHLCWHIGA